MHASSAHRLAYGLTVVHAVCLLVLVGFRGSMPESQPVFVLLLSLITVQVALLGLWGAYGFVVWWRRMGHIIVSAGYMAAALMPSGLAPNESFLVAFLVSWAFAAFASSVMILVFLMAVGRHWRIDYSPVADSDRRRSIQYSTYYGLKMLLVVAILIVFFAKMASWKTHDIGDALLMYAYTLFAILLTVILAVPSSLGAVSPLRGLCMVSVLAVFLGLMPFLAGHGWAPSFLSQYTVLTPAVLMASLLSLRAHGIRLIYSSR